MPYNTKVGRGSLGKSRRTLSEGAPTYIGSVTFTEPVRANEKLWLAAWIKKDDQGRQFFSISFERPAEQQREAAPPPQRYPAPRRDDMDDEIPF